MPGSWNILRVGFWLALIPPFLSTYAGFEISNALLVLVGYVSRGETPQILIQPKPMGDWLNMSPPVLAASLFIRRWFLCPVGALIAEPMSMAVQQLVLQSSDG